MKTVRTISALPTAARAPGSLSLASIRSHFVRICVETRIRHGMGEGGENISNQPGRRLSPVEGEIDRLTGRNGRAVEVGIDEFDVLGDSDGPEHTPGDRVVEGLGQLPSPAGPR